MMRGRGIIGALALFASVGSAAASYEALPERARRGKLGAALRKAAPTAGAPVTGQFWLDVPLDYNSDASGTFRIRWYINNATFNASDPAAPIFLAMGGESSTTGTGCSQAAISYGALCAGVEHRFYGESVPEGSVNTSNLKAGLYTEYNLADTAAIVEELWSRYGKRPVVATGGSYSGATCAWFRQAYPDHAAGCVSSSGVVDARWDFPEFDEHVAGAIDCADALRNATAAMERKFQAGEGDEVLLAFNASNLIGATLRDDFWYAVADGAAMLDQYGHKATLCAGVDIGGDASDDARIAALVALYNEQYGEGFVADCFYSSDCLRNITGTEAPSLLGSAANSRSWRYQKCGELGYLQRAPADPLRARQLTLGALERQCDYIFGPGTVAAGRARNRDHNARFGGLEPRSGAFPDASNILYLDFSDDPWAEVSVKNATDPTLPYCLTTCDGCGHCGTPSDECAAAETAFLRTVLGK